MVNWRLSWISAALLLACSMTMLGACSSDVSAHKPCGDFNDTDVSDRSGFTDVRADWRPKLPDDWEPPTDVPLMNTSSTDDSAVLGGNPQRFSAIRSGSDCDSPFTRHQTVSDEHMEFQLYIFFKNYGTGKAISNETRIALFHPNVLYGREEITSVIWSDNSTVNAVSSSVVLTVPSGEASVSMEVVDATAYMANGNTYELDSEQIDSPRGIPVGCWSASGEVHPVEDCNGYVLVNIKLHEISLATTMQASATEPLKFVNSYTITSPREIFLISLSYENDSNLRLRNVALGVRLDEQQQQMFEVHDKISYRVNNGEWLPGDLQGGGHVFGEVLPAQVVEVSLALRAKDSIWSALCSAKVTLLEGMFSREGAYAASDSLPIYPELSKC